MFLLIWKRISVQIQFTCTLIHTNIKYLFTLRCQNALRDTLIAFPLQLLQNYKVHFVPGWDCHGLPIELKGKCFILFLAGKSFALRLCELFVALALLTFSKWLVLLYLFVPGVIPLSCTSCLCPLS